MTGADGGSSTGSGVVPGPRRRAACVVGIVLGVVLAVVGAFVLSTSPPVGWFAYAPLSDTVFRPEGYLLNGLSVRQVVAMVCVVLGLLVAGFSAGFLVARRRHA